MVTAEELSDICGVTPNKRRAWARAGDLRHRHRFEELDAIELAVYARMREVAGPKRGRAAWKDLRSRLAPHLLASPRALWATIEVNGVVRHELATTARGLTQTIGHGRAVHVIDLRTVIERARAGYREAVSPHGSRKRADGAVRFLRGNP